MSLYGKYILPKVVDLACKATPNRQQREKVIPMAKGNVLEVGIGSGLNLPFYDSDEVNHLTAIDPSKAIWRENTVDTGQLPFPFEFIVALAEDIPADNNSFDSVVITYTLCTIVDTQKALSEIRRVLKPTGKLLFCEHGRSPEKSMQRWQQIINPIWSLLGGGCNLTRNIPVILESNGFMINHMDANYIPGWKPASFDYRGIAKPN